MTACPLWAAPPPAQLAQGPPASFQGPPSLMDTETDEYMDYTGCSPGAMSSESSTMDRSCSSTPVGNESTAAGEQAARTGPRGVWEAPGLGRAPPPEAQQCRVWLRTGASLAKWPQRRTGQCVAGPAGLWDMVPHLLPPCPPPLHSALGFRFQERTQA